MATDNYKELIKAISCEKGVYIELDKNDIVGNIVGKVGGINRESKRRLFEWQTSLLFQKIMFQINPIRTV